MAKLDKKYQELELNILNLGTEIYLLKNQMNQMNQMQCHFVEILKGLKLLLDEKGILDSDDFEHAADFCQSLSEIEIEEQNHMSDELEKIKKTSH